ncbi:MAG: 2-oxo acid dehydrogenase subunit E2, partial [Acidobacteria bacterium]|nr:2-oxo acid dehydrogenase subunit E2 [Acidobacteriota bacterium]
EPIAEVETDKTTVELEAPAGGVLAEIRIPAGAQTIAVGTVLALVRGGATGETGTRARPAETVSGSGAGASTPAPASGAVDNGLTAPVRETAPGAAATAVSPGEAEQTVGTSPATTDAPASPLARRMAELAGLDLSGVAGSGAGGRVMKVDVERLLRPSAEGDAGPAQASARASEPPAPALPTVAPVSDLPHSDRPLTAMRRVTAQRMAEAKRSAPHFYLEAECAVDALLALRETTSPADGAGAPTLNDVVVRAAALALREVPLANSAWTGDALRVYDRVDLAVAVTTPGGLVTPVIRAADTKPLAAIAADLRRLAADARAGRLQPADYQGGTCTISNLGMYGVSSLYAILNPPQSCILGVGAVTERPVIRDGAVAVGSTMTVTLSADHRAIDGATGAELLRALKALLEDPQQVYG